MTDDDLLLEDFTVRVVFASEDPQLVHLTCQTVICTVQHDDTLRVLLATARTHRCSDVTG